MKTHHIGAPKYGRTGADVFRIIAQVKFVAVEIAAAIVFFVWLYREVIHELRR